MLWGLFTYVLLTQQSSRSVILLTTRLMPKLIDTVYMTKIFSFLGRDFRPERLAFCSVYILR